MASDKLTPGARGQEGLSFVNALHQGCGAGVILIDQERKAATLTAGAEQILNLATTRGTAVSFDVLPVALLQLARDAATTGRPISGRTVEIPAGRTPRLALRVTAMPLEGDATRSSVALVLADLTLIRQFERHVLQLDRLAGLGTLAAGMAHEIKNALVAGRTFIDLLLEKNQDQELAQIVRREIGRIDTMVTRMLRFAGRSGGTFSAVHMHEILEHSLRLVEGQLGEKSITLTQSLDAGSDVVNGDEHELQQALVNLLLNAVEAMGPRGNLKVGTRLRQGTGPDSEVPEDSDETWLCITIEDTGLGIPVEIMDRLFEPFVTTKPNGTGLGLAITQGIIRQHRGTIAAKSPPGQGTTFTITLPAIDPAR